MVDGIRQHALPQTVEDAAELLLSDLLMQHLQALSNMTENAFDQLCDQVAPYLLDEFKIWQGNDILLDACFSNCEGDPEPARVILKHVKKMLRNFRAFLVIT
jgi:hypothetical protein